MPKCAIIVHGWGGNPQEGWLPWLKEQLEQRGFSLEVPTMPETDTPKKELWVPHLAAVVGKPDEDTYLIGHSMGCQTILRYLESLPNGLQVGGVLLIAGFIELTGLTPEEKPVWQAWLETPLDLAKVKTRSRAFTAIFSDNDGVVPLENKVVFERDLGATTIVLHNKGHFSGSDGISKLPEALDAVLSMAKVA